MLYSGAKGTMTPNNRLQRTALRAAAEPERWAPRLFHNEAATNGGDSLVAIR